jgi:hypothetical protein
VNGALVAKWRLAVVGREMKALEYGVEVAEYWGKLAEEGKCTVPETFFSTCTAAMWMVKGDLDVLRGIMATDAAQILILKGEWLLDSFGYEFLITGADADARLGHWAKAGEALGLV